MRVSRARAIPKSMTRGPSMVTRTLDGLRSRWTIPAAWMSLEGVREPGGEDAHRVLGQRPVVVPDDLRQARPGDVPGGDPGDGGLGVGVEDGRRPVPPDAPRGGDLLPEAGPELVLLGQLPPDELDGDRTPPLGPGDVHMPHAARTEPRDQPVRPDPHRITVPELVHARAASPVSPPPHTPGACRHIPARLATPCRRPHLKGVGGAPSRRTGHRPTYHQYEGPRPALPQPPAGGTPRARTCSDISRCHGGRATGR